MGNEAETGRLVLGDVRERLEYVRCLLGEMRGITQGDRHDLLTYLVEMAYVEASDMLRAGRGDTPVKQSKLAA